MELNSRRNKCYKDHLRVAQSFPFLSCTRVLRNKSSLSNKLMEILHDLEHRIRPCELQGIHRHGLELIRLWPKPLSHNACYLMRWFGEFTTAVLYHIRYVPNFLQEQIKMMKDGRATSSETWYQPWSRNHPSYTPAKYMLQLNQARVDRGSSFAPRKIPTPLVHPTSWYSIARIGIKSLRVRPMILVTNKFYLPLDLHQHWLKQSLMNPPSQTWRTFPWTSHGALN